MNQNMEKSLALTSPGYTFSRWLRIILFCGMGFVCLNAFEWPAAAAAQLNSEQKTPDEIEYEVKAAFIYNFTKFIQWPAEKDKANADLKTIQILIIGKNPFKKAFQQILEKNVQGRTIQLTELESFEQFRRSYPNKQAAMASYQQAYLPIIEQSHVLFICSSEKGSVADLAALTRGQALVTVSDIDNFAAENGMIGFVNEKQKVRFEINLDIANTENVKISSQLLNLARTVYKKPQAS